MEYFVAGLLAPIFRLLFIAPIVWILYRVIPNGAWKVTLFQEFETPDEARRRMYGRD